MLRLPVVGGSFCDRVELRPAAGVLARSAPRTIDGIAGVSDRRGTGPRQIDSVYFHREGPASAKIYSAFRLYGLDHGLSPVMVSR